MSLSISQRHVFSTSETWAQILVNPITMSLYRVSISERNRVKSYTYSGTRS